MGKFAQQAEALAKMCKRRQLAVFRDSAQQVAHEANTPKSQGGKMPVDTEFLRNSIAAAIGEMPGVGGLPPEIVVLSAELGDKVFIGWTAAYARRIEYGFQGRDSLGRSYNQKGAGFLRAAVQRWPQIVAASVKKVQAIK